MRGKKVWLRFGGASLKADVWLNGKHLGTAQRVVDGDPLWRRVGRSLS
jgi:hypothetical protein